MENLKIVRFVNFTSEDFIGQWNSVPQLIPAGHAVPMEEWRAYHYAKHLINRELQRIENGKEVYPGGIKFTSPRKPQDIPIWRELLAKCIVTGDAKEVPVDHAAMEVLKQAEKKADIPLAPQPIVDEAAEAAKADTEVITFKCDCGVIAKSNAGLKAHQRSHRESFQESLKE